MNDYNELIREPKKLPKKRKSKIFEKHYSNGIARETPYGSYFEITTESHLTVPSLRPDRVWDEILHTLELLPKIQAKTKEKLNQCGIMNLLDLAESKHTLAPNAQHFIQTVFKQRNIPALLECIKDRLKQKHFLNLMIGDFYAPENWLFFDIETLGLNDCPVFLIGVGHFTSQNTFTVRQFLKRAYDEEEAILFAFRNYLSHEAQLLVSYNGRSFDLPFLSRRYDYLGLEPLCAPHHFDALPYTRAALPHLPRHKLTSIEAHCFGLYREDDVPSEFVPYYYEEYERKRKVEILAPVITHHYQDIVSLARLYLLLRDEFYKQ